VSKHKYKLKHFCKHEFGSFTKEEILEGGPECTGTDAMMIVSFLFENGGVSWDFGTLDGRDKGQLSDIEIFKFWAYLAQVLSESETLSTNLKEFTGEVFAEIKAAVQRARGE